MTQPTHTPAPWAYNPIPQMGYYNIEDAKGNIIGRFSNETDAIKATAAPELLEALELFVNSHREPHDKEGYVAREKALSAIAKARG